MPAGWVDGRRSPTDRRHEITTDHHTRFLHNFQATLPLWPGADSAQWWGNFAGDFMWTIEPILVLTVPPVIASIREAYLVKLQAARKKDE